MSSIPTPGPGATEQLRQQFTAAVSRMWTDEWSQRSTGDGYRWFRHAWRDTRRILDQTPPVADERIEQYAARLRAQCVRGTASAMPACFCPRSLPVLNAHCL